MFETCFMAKLNSHADIIERLFVVLTFSSKALLPDLSDKATMTPMLASLTSGVGSFADFDTTGSRVEFSFRASFFSTCLTQAYKEQNHSDHNARCCHFFNLFKKHWFANSKRIGFHCWISLYHDVLQYFLADAQNWGGIWFSWSWFSVC